MKLSEAEKNKVYVLIEGNSTVKKGDHVWFSDNGHLNVVEGLGWLEGEELDDKFLSLTIMPADNYEILKYDGRECCIRHKQGEHHVRRTAEKSLGR